jgi:hypothetical protein
MYGGKVGSRVDRLEIKTFLEYFNAKKSYQVLN